MSDLTREQIEERRRWIEATAVNPEYATVLCDMALRTLEAEEREQDAEDREEAAQENWSHEVEHLGERAEQAEERNRQLEADLSSLRGAYYAAIQQLQRMGAESVPLYPDPAEPEQGEPADYRCANCGLWASRHPVDIDDPGAGTQLLCTEPKRPRDEPAPTPDAKKKPDGSVLHPSHDIRARYDGSALECSKCGHTDWALGWRKLSEPCPADPAPTPDGGED